MATTARGEGPGPWPGGNGGIRVRGNLDAPNATGAEILAAAQNELIHKVDTQAQVCGATKYKRCVPGQGEVLRGQSIATKSQSYSFRSFKRETNKQDNYWPQYQRTSQLVIDKDVLLHASPHAFLTGRAYGKFERYKPIKKYSVNPFSIRHFIEWEQFTSNRRGCI